MRGVGGLVIVGMDGWMDGMRRGYVGKITYLTNWKLNESLEMNGFLPRVWFDWMVTCDGHKIDVPLHDLVF